MNFYILAKKLLMEMINLTSICFQTTVEHTTEDLI